VEDLEAHEVQAALRAMSAESNAIGELRVSLEAEAQQVSRCVVLHDSFTYESYDVLQVIPYQYYIL
jgi:hypothetical protein